MRLVSSEGFGCYRVRKRVLSVIRDNVASEWDNTHGLWIGLEDDVFFVVSFDDVSSNLEDFVYRRLRECCDEIVSRG